MSLNVYIVTNCQYYFLCLSCQLPQFRPRLQREHPNNNRRIQIAAHTSTKHILGRLGVNNLANGERNHGRLARTRLCLGNDVTTGDNGEHRPLLDGGGLLEAVIVDASEEIILYPHLVEAHDGLHALRRLEHKLRVVLLHRPPRAAASLNRRSHAAPLQ
ncbi:homolog of RAD51 D [Striga asiatica]|uniref:Homolog of RAD51 D n=1 Tax=Striga asiatica TaxID=4170 RepID=A0A5A7PCN1_STRAF|nr:homolog of RAD51 D [Striga asiatica]